MTIVAELTLGLVSLICLAVGLSRVVPHLLYSPKQRALRIVNEED